jgi:hypothetical protein
MRPPGRLLPIAPPKNPPLTRRAASTNPIRTAHDRAVGSRVWSMKTWATRILLPLYFGRSIQFGFGRIKWLFRGRQHISFLCPLRCRDNALGSITQVVLTRALIA